MAVMRLSKRALLTLAAASLLVPAILLSLVSLKLLRDFTETTGDFRSEYGSYIARLAATSVEEALWEQEQLSMVSARLSPPKDPQQVMDFLHRSLSKNPHYLMAFFAVPQGLVHYSQFRMEETRDLRPLPEWLHKSVLASMSHKWTMPSGLIQITAPDSLPPVQVTYFSVHAESGRLLGTAGFVWDLDRLKREQGFFERVLTRDVLSNHEVFRGAIFQSPVVVILLDEKGEAFFTSTETAEFDFIAQRQFNRVLSFYQVGIQLSDDQFDAWVQSVTQTNLAIIAAMFLVVVVGVVFSLRYVAHEMELAELKSTLVSNVSHELKTPLALIRLFSETLEMGRVENPEKQKEFLRVIHKESDRLTHLIDNVLDLGRIEQGRKTYSKKSVNLSELVRTTLNAYRLQLEQSGFEHELNIEDGLPAIHADPDAITQALLNLLDNAVKYSQDEKWVRVELTRSDNEAVIQVLDRGIGISPREQSKIFDMFYRVEKGLVHSVKGSGLGLSLVKHIVDAHKGRVIIDSQPGRGSRFSIHLPLDATSDEETA